MKEFKIIVRATAVQAKQCQWQYLFAATHFAELFRENLLQQIRVSKRRW